MSKKLEQVFKSLLENTGEDLNREDLNREGLQETPERASRAFEFITRGYREDINKVVGEALFTTDSDDMILVKDIELYSLCEHHILPFFGRIHVAYIPNGRVLGLSKIPRLVEIFARRLQVQERMTVNIAETLEELLEPKGVAVVVEASNT